MTPTIHLHIGEPKSGTTYLQAMLEENRATLEGAGLLTPGPREQIRAAQDAIRRTSDGALWQALADRLLQWSGTDALVSMETLCRANPPAVKRAASAFGDADLRVHITVRDTLRSLPAQWQQSTQHRKTWTWHEYATAVVSADKSHPATNNFWSQHDLETILQRWTKVAGAQNVYVITVPQSGADPTLLWRRFADALGLPTVDVQSVAPSNESLGVVSAELMRRVNEAVEPLDLSEQQYNTAVRAFLAREVLAPRRSDEPKVLPPTAAGAWAEAEADRLIAATRRLDVNVVGDLEELRPASSAFNDDPQPADSDVLDAAVDALRAMVVAIGKKPKRLSDQQVD
jgi:hypothetical protein